MKNVRIKFILSFIILINIVASCFYYPETQQANTDSSNRTYEIKPSQNLDDYMEALLNWRRATYGLHTTHFPSALTGPETYELFYSRHVLQAHSTFCLKIEFSTFGGAAKYFHQKSDYNFEQEFTTTSAYTNSNYCTSTSFGFVSMYELPENCTIRLLNAALCVGQGDVKLGGIESSIALDRESKSVICWVKEREV